MLRPKINRRWLAVITGGLALLAGLLLASTTSAGAATGGVVEAESTRFVQGTVDGDNNPVFVTAEFGFGTPSITQCLDTYCRDSVTNQVLFNNTEDILAFGFTVVPDGRAVIGANVININTAESRNEIIVCSDTTCDTVLSRTPAPAVGTLHARPNNTFVIIDDTNITRCRNLDCSGDLRVEAHGVANFRDVTLDEFDPVFVTADAVHYCNSGLCQDAETVVPHNLDVFADQISLTADGRPQIYVNGFLTGDDNFSPEFHTCVDRSCSDIEVETLSFGEGGRESAFVIDGNPSRVLLQVQGLATRVELLASSDQFCIATVSGNNLTLSFDGNVGDDAILRVNGRFVADVTGLDSFTTADGRTPIIRSWIDNEFVDVPCLNGQAPQPTPTPAPTPTPRPDPIFECTVTVQRGGIADVVVGITNDVPFGDASINFRDDRWIATVDPNDFAQAEIFEVSRVPDTAVIRINDNQDRFDIPCELEVFTPPQPPTPRPDPIFECSVTVQRGIVDVVVGITNDVPFGDASINFRDDRWIATVHPNEFAQADIFEVSRVPDTAIIRIDDNRFDIACTR